MDNNTDNSKKRVTNEMIYKELLVGKKDSDELVKKINDIHKVIYGNGNTEKSVIHKLATIFTTLKIHWALFSVILGLLVKIAFFA